MMALDAGGRAIGEDAPRAGRPEDWRDFETLRAATALYRDCHLLQARLRSCQTKLARMFLSEAFGCPLDLSWAAPLFFVSWLRTHRPSVDCEIDLDLWEDASIGAAAAWARDGFENPGIQRLIIAYGSSRIAISALRAARAGEVARVTRLASPDLGWPVRGRPAYALVGGATPFVWYELPL